MDSVAATMRSAMSAFLRSSAFLSVEVLLASRALLLGICCTAWVMVMLVEVLDFT